MKPRLLRLGRRSRLSLAVPAVLAAACLTPAAAGAHNAHGATGSGTVLQTNLVSDLPGAASLTDPNLVNPWGISESSGSPFWISDNNAGVSTLYNVPGTGSTPASINPLVVDIPTPVSATGGTPTGTVFNTASASDAFQITGQNASGQTTTVPALFLFATEDGTIIGWNPAINSTHAVIAVDNSGNNFTNPHPNKQTGAVYKGLAIETSATPIFPTDASSTALLYASNFRDRKVEVYDANFNRVALPTGAFRDPRLPGDYAPFNVQALDGKVYVTYAKQDAVRHDDVGGPHRGFVDVFNPDGSPGLPHGKVRLITRGTLDSPWGLAIPPQGFAGLSAPDGDPVLLVGNFRDGFIHAFDATNGDPLGQLTDADGKPIHINSLWALQVGNGGTGGAADTVYFTAGIFDEAHGLFGSLTTSAPGSPEGPAETQAVQADRDVVQLDQQQLANDTANGAPAATIKQDNETLHADSAQLAADEQALTQEGHGRRHERIANPRSGRRSGD